MLEKPFVVEKSVSPKSKNASPKTHPKTTDKMQEILDKFASFHSPPLESVHPAVARQLPTFTDAVLAVTSEHMMKRLGGFVLPVGKVEHKLIPGPAGDILLRIYSPTGEGPFPVLLYFHGGGWVIANLDTYDGSCRALTDAADFIVVSVAYRQAPEHKYPAPVEDAFAAYQWLIENCHSINADAKCICVGGESAGGNLATVVSLLARDQNIRLPDHQLLIYPVTNCAFDTASYQTHKNAKPLNKAMMQWFWTHYLPDESAAESPYVSPLRASLTGLPSATIITAEIDPLCSEGEDYARKLSDAGINVRHERFLGVTHEFFGMVPLLPEAKDALAIAAEQLKMVRDSDEVSTREQWTAVQSEAYMNSIAP